MRVLEKVVLDERELTIDMGYRNDMRIIVHFTDQNNITHEESFMFRVFGEKPTIFEIRRESELLFSIADQYSGEVK